MQLITISTMNWQTFSELAFSFTLNPEITLKSIANDEPPAMEVLVDRPEEVSGVTRVAGPWIRGSGRGKNPSAAPIEAA